MKLTPSPHPLRKFFLVGRTIFLGKNDPPHATDLVSIVCVLQSGSHFMKDKVLEKKKKQCIFEIE